jgi:TonB family protein
MGLPATTTPPQAWSWQTCLLLGAVLFVGEGAVVVKMTRWPVAPTPELRRIATAYLPRQESGAENGWQGITWSDPAEFAVPDLRKPTGLMGQTTVLPVYDVVDFKAPIHYLPPVSPPITVEMPKPDSLRPTPLSNPAQSRIGSEKRAPRLLPTNSWVDIRGGTRKLAVPVDPKSWPTAELLNPSRVAVAVLANGEIFSARLIGSSGNTAADGEALRLARTAKFEPVSSSGTADGLDPGTVVTQELVFHWHTVSP